MKVGRNLDIGREITVEDKIAGQRTSKSTEHTGRYNITVAQDLNITGKNIMAGESVKD